LSSYPILADKGKVSALQAKLKAEGEYEVYRKRQDAEFVSDFDRVVEEAQRLGRGARVQIARDARSKAPSKTPAGSGGKKKRPR
jgi:hypothetical protein